MKARVNLNICFDIDVEEATEETIKKIQKKIEKCRFTDRTKIAKNIQTANRGQIDFVDDDGVELEWVINDETFDTVYYRPSCVYGYTNCVLDPMYMKSASREWWEECGCPTECEHCVDGSDYDDECK